MNHVYTDMPGRLYSTRSRPINNRWHLEIYLGTESEPQLHQELEAMIKDAAMRLAEEVENWCSRHPLVVDNGRD